MSLLFEKSIVQGIIQQRINNLPEKVRELVQKMIVLEEVFCVDPASGLFDIEINPYKVKNLFSELQGNGLITVQDVAEYVILLSKIDLFNSTVQAICKLNTVEVPAELNDRINMLIDIKTMDNPQLFHSFLGDILEATLPPDQK